MAGDGHRVQVQHGADLLHDRGHAAGIVEELRGPASGRADVEQVVRAAVQAVERLRIQIDAKLVRDGGQVQQAVRRARDRRMGHDRVFKALARDDLPRCDALAGKLRRAQARAIGGLLELRLLGRHQRRAGQRQPQRLGHDLHRRGRAHEAARAAAGAGMVLVVRQLLLRDLAAPLHGAVLADLLQRQQVGPGGHHAARHHNGGDVDAPDAHQLRGHGLVAAGDEHARVKRRGVGVHLDHARDQIPMRKRIVDAVVPLRHAVADVRGKVACRFGAAILRAAHCRLDEAVEVCAAGVAVAIRALHEHLRPLQILARPAHAHAQRVHLRRERAHLLAA